MVVVFDVDETLYSEQAFVVSGLKAVASYLRRTFSVPWGTAVKLMMRRRKDGSRKVFDEVLMKYGLYNRGNVKKCLATYYSHIPRIKLDKDADSCLKRLKQYPLYVVTDGHKLIQNRKLQALGLHKRVRRCFLTHRFGVKNAKPSPYCFLKICRQESVPPEKVVYVGDNPVKDFVGIKPLGFKTVRVLKGQFKAAKFPRSLDADYRISSLDELTPAFLENIEQV